LRTRINSKSYLRDKQSTKKELAKKIKKKLINDSEVVTLLTSSFFEIHEKEKFEPTVLNSTFDLRFCNGEFDPGSE
jgi:hypothetical protein